MKKAIVTLLLLGALGGSVYGYYRYRSRAPEPTVTTAALTTR